MANQKPVRLYPIPLEEAVAALLRTVPERKNPQAIEQAGERFEQRAARRATAATDEKDPEGTA